MNGHQLTLMGKARLEFNNNNNNNNKPRSVPQGTEEMSKKKPSKTGKLIYIDELILQKTKMRRNSLFMAWIDNKNSSDKVLQSCIIHCLKLYKKSHPVPKFIEKSTETEIVHMTTGGKCLAEVNIQTGRVQGDEYHHYYFYSNEATQSHSQDRLRQTQTNEVASKINHFMYIDKMNKN